jgi:hypothetical protein
VNQLTRDGVEHPNTLGTRQRTEMLGHGFGELNLERHSPSTSQRWRLVSRFSPQTFTV